MRGVEPKLNGHNRESQRPLPLIIWVLRNGSGIFDFSPGLYLACPWYILCLLDERQ